MTARASNILSNYTFHTSNVITSNLRNKCIFMTFFRQMCSSTRETFLFGGWEAGWATELTLLSPFITWTWVSDGHGDNLFNQFAHRVSTLWSSIYQPVKLSVVSLAQEEGMLWSWLPLKPFKLWWVCFTVSYDGYGESVLTGLLWWVIADYHIHCFIGTLNDYIYKKR